LLGVPFTPDALAARVASLAPLGASFSDAPRSPVSRAELRRLLSLSGTPAAEVNVMEFGVEGGDCASPLSSPAASPAASDEEDPAAEPPLAPVSAAAAPPQHRCRVRAVVVAWRGYAVVHVEYEDEVPLSLLRGGAAAVELPGPLAARLAWVGGGGGGCDAPTLALDCTGAQPPTWHPDVLPSGLPAAAHLTRFCAALGARVAVVAAGTPLCEAAAAAAGAGVGAGAETGRFPLQLRAVLPVPAASSPAHLARVTRRYAWGGVSDGHTLCVALPLGKAAATSVRAECAFLDDELAGMAGVVCPTGPVRVWGGRGAQGGAAPPRLAVEALGGGGDSGGGGAPPLLLRGGGCCVLLLEPGNVATVWRGLRCGAAGQPPGGLCAPPPPPPQGAPAPPPVTSAQLPRHVAVIMDGNGRWAQARGLRRADGHRAGVSAIHTLIRAARRLRIPFLTLYAFSAQNWARPDAEVKALMALLGDFVATDLEELCANGVRLLVNGDEARLPLGVRGGLARMVESSAGNRGLTLCLALSYGGREEIAGAAAAACRAAAAGALDPAALTVDAFRAFLPHPHSPDPDLLLRTSGELRVSNFLLWHIAYAEIFVSAALWPDFGDEALAEALSAYAARERRFGKTGEQVRGGAGDTAEGGHQTLTLQRGGIAGTPATAAAAAALWCRRCARAPCHARAAAASSAPAQNAPSTLGTLACALVPFLALLVALSALFLFAPVALRLGLVQAPPPGTCAFDAPPPAPLDSDEKPCLVVLLDGGTCSSARKLAARALHGALRLRDRLLYGR
jgi:undecaprenyl diphosphate synthase